MKKIKQLSLFDPVPSLDQTMTKISDLQKPLETCINLCKDFGFNPDDNNFVKYVKNINK